MVLVYIGKAEPNHYEGKFLSSLEEEGTSLRTASLWKGEVERGFDVVYTNDDRIKAKYAAAGMTVKAIPKAEHKPAKKVPRPKKPAPKKGKA